MQPQWFTQQLNRLMAPATRQTLSKGLGVASLYTGFGVALKGIGSTFRLHDLKDAPKPVFNERLTQESALLFMAGVVTLAAQVFLPLVFKHFNIVSEIGRNALRSVMIAPGYIASEIGSRQLGDVSWQGMVAKMAEAANEGQGEEGNASNRLLKQLVDFLYRPQVGAPVGMTQGAVSNQSFGGKVGQLTAQLHGANYHYNPANRLSAPETIHYASKAAVHHPAQLTFDANKPYIHGKPMFSSGLII